MPCAKMKTIMAAGKLDLTIEQGSTFSIRLTLKYANNVPIDLTGAVMVGQIREFPGSLALLATFTCTIVSPGNSGIALIEMTDAVTASIPVTVEQYPARRSQVYCYDIQAQFLDGTVKRILEGAVNFSPEVTK